MITLAPEHYARHVKDHAKDTEFLNAPIANYQQMQTIFGCGVATGRFAMGSNEALGQPAADQDTIDLDSEAPPTAKEDATSSKKKVDDKKSGKRKRMLSDEDPVLLTGVTDVIWGLGAAVSEGNHSEATPGIYEAVMGCTNFTRADRMICLDYLMGHMGPAMVFVGMDLKDKELWCRTHLAKIFQA